MERSGNKKARTEPLEVKQEGRNQESGSAIVVAAPLEAKITIEFEQSLLECPLCSVRLKPPVFQCRDGHTACGSCAAIHSNKCHTCVDGKYEHIRGLDIHILAAKVPCDNDKYGCQSMVTYGLMTEHQQVCPHAPCYCPEKECFFCGSPPMLYGHLKVVHKWPMTPIVYGKVLALKMEPMERQRLLVTTKEEDEERMFLLVARERLGGGRDIKLVCVRANETDGWWYRLLLWVYGPVNEKTGRPDLQHQEVMVTNCAIPCEEEAMAMEVEGTVLQVPSKFFPGGRILLNFRIDKLPVQVSPNINTAAGAAHPI